MPKLEEAYPVGSVVRLKHTNQFVLIIDHALLMDWIVLHYSGIIEGRKFGVYAIQHDDIDFECLPPADFDLAKEVAKLGDNYDPGYKWSRHY